MKTFAQYAEQRSIQSFAETLLEQGYDVEEVVSYFNYIIENNEDKDGEVIINELLSGLMNVGRGLMGGAASGIGKAASAAGRGLMRGASAVGRGLGQAASAVGQGAAAVGNKVGQAASTAGQWAADKYHQGEQSGQLSKAISQLNTVSQTLQQLGVANPQVQQLFAALNNHLTGLAGTVAGDQKARFGGMNMQMPTA